MAHVCGEMRFTSMLENLTRLVQMDSLLKMVGGRCDQPTAALQLPADLGRGQTGAVEEMRVRACVCVYINSAVGRNCSWPRTRASLSCSRAHVHTCTADV